MPTKTNRRHTMSQRGDNSPRDENQQRLEDPADKARNMVEDSISYLRDYARQKPETAALWCLGIGFVLGWKLKPW